MPEIKHDFSAGKMNKDLDERLVPNGEYRDALNIQVRTTDGGDDGVGDAGTVQNVQGNKQIASSAFTQGYSEVNGVLSESTVVASVPNEKNNSAYFFVAGADIDKSWNLKKPEQVTEQRLFIDTIMEVKETNGGITDRPIVVDLYGIVDSYENVFGVYGPEGTGIYADPYNTIKVLDSSKYSVGMVISAYEDGGIQLFDNAEIQNIDTTVSPNYDEITLNQQQTASLQNCVAVVFRREGVLKFSSLTKVKKKITGINIIDNLLFWTDNYNEPKKINIDRCIAGTNSYTTHTKLMIPNPVDTDNIVEFDNLEYILSPSVNNDLKEEHITVIRKAPLTAPNLELRRSDRQGLTDILDVTQNLTIESVNDGVTSYVQPPIGSTITITNDLFNGVDYQINDILIWTQNESQEDFGGGGVVVKFSINSITIDEDTGNTSFNLTFLTISGEITTSSTLWDIELQQGDPLFELKLCRFGYRYTYADNEISSFSPWSELAFLPGRFDYNHKKGYNLGMVNHVRHLVIKDFIPHTSTRPDDVVAVDILYKATDSANVYIVKTIKREKDPEWELFTPGNGANTGINSMTFGKFSITSEMIHRTLPSNQTLRAWDNVPRYALAQEIAANRVVYGNYIQGYDINYPVKLTQNHLMDDSASITEPKKSIKSIRDYKFGMVFGDKYGRETPVISPGNIVGDSPENYTPTTGDTRISKQFSAKRNSFELAQDWDSPGSNPGVPLQWMDYVKYYVKETTNEYYNLIMDKWYNAEDGNIWLSFSSSDRNKVDEETYLILKNEHGTNTPVLEKARYKIISIKSEAPDFIKIDERKMGRIKLSDNEVSGIFLDALNPNPATTVPSGLTTNNELELSASVWDQFLENYEMKGDLKLRIIGKVSNEEKFSMWKNVTHNTGGGEGESAKIIWSEPFGDDSDMLSRFVAGGSTIPVNGLEYFLEIKEDVISNKPEFDGKFFVKIEKDITLEEKILIFNAVEGEYVPTIDYPLALISSQKLHPSFELPGAPTATFANSTDMPYRNYIWGTEGGANGAVTSTEADEQNSNGNNILEVPPPNTHNQGNCSFMGLPTISWGLQGAPIYGNIALKTKAFWEWWIPNNGNINGYGLKTRMFIDAARSRKIELNGVDANEISEFMRPTGLDQGLQSGSGFTSTEENMDLGRMFVSICRWGFIGDEAGFRNKMQSPGTIFSFTGDPNAIRYKIVGTSDNITFGKNFDTPGSLYTSPLLQPNSEVFPGDPNTVPGGDRFDQYLNELDTDGTLLWGSNSPPNGFLNLPENEYLHVGWNTWDNDGDNHREGFRFEFRRIDPETTTELIEGGSRGIDTTVWDPRALVPHDGRKRLSIITYDRKYSGGDVYVPESDAGVWETEPKEDVGLDIYYEASNSIPMVLNSENTSLFAPYNAPITVKQGSSDDGFVDVSLTGADHRVWTIGYTANSSVIGIRHTNVAGQTELFKEDISVGDFIVFHHENDTQTMSMVTNFMGPNIEHGDDANLIETVFTPTALGQNTQGLTIVYAGYNLSDGSAVIQITNGDGSNLQVGQVLTDENSSAIIPNNVFITSIFGNNIYISVNNSSWLDTVGPAPYTSLKTGALAATGYYEIESQVWQYPVKLPWHNCYSFGNGVESDRIRDDFNAPTIDNGVVVSTTLDEYGKETKGSGMIYSGLYNSTSGVNNLNEFNMADTITKDLNPSYGSIQALKTRDSDVVVFTEDKVLKVTTNKDALFNADGNPQLLASNKVLGTAVPFVGDYGISKNPESMVSDQYRVYFTDMQRGAVMRLSRDGLTPISSVGMKTWFRENLKKTQLLLGTFDVVNGEYNLTLDYPGRLLREVYDDGTPDVTVSFNESSKGWVSFKSFVPQGGVSVGGKYITATKNTVYEHYVDEIDNVSGLINNRNTFYGIGYNSSLKVMFNDMPSAVKTFRTISYEGSQSYVRNFNIESTVDAAGNTLSLNDGEYYNLTSNNGWYVDSFKTDLQEGKVPEFIKKEGKWFNKINGDDKVSFSSDSSEFTVQGIGTVSSVLYEEGGAFEITVEADMINDTTD